MPDKWVIVGTETCSWCEKAKRLLEEHNQKFTWFNLSRDLTLFSFLAANGLQTVPQVYLNGNRIGGYEDTKNYLETLDEGTN